MEKKIDDMSFEEAFEKLNKILEEFCNYRIKEFKNYKKKYDTDFLKKVVVGVHQNEKKITKMIECNLNKKTKGTIIIKGFGSTDCNLDCKSHLKYLGN